MLREGVSTSLTKLKVKSESKEADELRTEQRKKNVMILILEFLNANGMLSIHSPCRVFDSKNNKSNRYHASYNQLQVESGVNMTKFCAADNMDLQAILQEYENYYNIKFGKQPKITRRLTSVEQQVVSQQKKRAPRQQAGPAAVGFDCEVEPLPRIRKNHIHAKTPEATESIPSRNSAEQKSHSLTTRDSSDVSDNMIIGTSAPLKKTIKYAEGAKGEVNSQELHDETPYDNKLLKPMPGYGNAEFRELAAIISRDIFMKNPNVRWNDIAGLSDSKRLIKEAVVFPMRYPELFTGILTPWKGLLLYGPPGTGKTMLAKAIATECKTTFFNISASSIVSKWRGDSEKLVRVLFELARYHAPSTIFLDELESIMSHRAGGGGEHEGSRRMKTELLIQLDGLAKTNDHVFLLAASNLPWELDMAMLRRLEKRILIGIPDYAARVAMFEKNLPPDLKDGYGVPAVCTDPGLDYGKLAEITEGYTGSDINLVCKEAAMRPLRRIFEQLDAVNVPEFDDSAKLSHGEPSPMLNRDPIRQLDVQGAILSTNPSCTSKISSEYQKWSQKHGSI